MKHKNKSVYSCDFETITKAQSEQEGSTRIWSYGIMKVLDLEILGKDAYEKESNIEFNYGTNMDEFMNWLVASEKEVFFHNLKFDGSFILNYLFRNNWELHKKGEEIRPNTFKTVITKTGIWHSIELCIGKKKNGKDKNGRQKYNYKTVTIKDSLKKLPFSVDAIGKDFKFPVLKGNIDYHTYRPIDWKLTDEEISYLKNDVEIIARAISFLHSQGMKENTIGSCALTNFKEIIKGKGMDFDSLFPSISHIADEAMRDSYKGGFTWLNERYRDKTINDGIVLDVNSLYPYIMKKSLLPYFEGIPYDGKYKHDEKYPLFIQCVELNLKLKNGHIPSFQPKGTCLSSMKNSDGTYTSGLDDNGYLLDTYDDLIIVVLTNVELKLIQKHYHVKEIYYRNGHKFQGRIGLFDDYIDYWTKIKIEHSKEKGSMYQLAKLMLNSLYGKFGTNPDITGKLTRLEEDVLKFSLPKDEKNNDIIELTEYPKYLPMACFITAYARTYTIETAQINFDRLIYCDTDSIHLVGTEIPENMKDLIHDSELGKWAHEYTFSKGKYLRQKTYYNVIDENKENDILKCAGMTKDIKKQISFDEFNNDIEREGKRVPKQFPGGVVIEEITFSMKKEINKFRRY